MAKSSSRGGGGGACTTGGAMFDVITRQFRLAPSELRPGKLASCLLADKVLQNSL